MFGPQAVTQLLPDDVPLIVGATVAAAANNQTLAAAVGFRTYIAGFAITGLGATAATASDVTITGIGTTPTFHVPIPAGVTVGINPLAILFNPPIPATADNTAIVVNATSPGAGNTDFANTVWGFRRKA